MSKQWIDKWELNYEEIKTRDFSSMVVVRWYKRFYDSCIQRLGNDEFSTNITISKEKTL